MRKQSLTYFTFALAGAGVILAFITATNYPQLAVAILFYPPLAFFAYKVLPIRQRHTELTAQAVTFPQATEQKTTDIKINNKTENVGISDIDKRVFLKLIGGTGISLLLFSIFSKKVGGLFPVGNSSASETVALLKDPSGSIIYPAQKKPLDDYSISDLENGAITFYGFISKDGSWYIMRLDTSTGAFRYTKDKSNFRANWSNRANLKYDYFDNVFEP